MVFLRGGGALEKFLEFMASKKIIVDCISGGAEIYRQGSKLLFNASKDLKREPRKSNFAICMRAAKKKSFLWIRYLLVGGGDFVWRRHFRVIGIFLPLAFEWMNWSVLIIQKFWLKYNLAENTYAEILWQTPTYGGQHCSMLANLHPNPIAPDTVPSISEIVSEKT